MITKTYQARKMRQEIELVEERPQGECVFQDQHSQCIREVDTVCLI